MKKFALAALLAVLATLSLSACDGDRPCLHGHDELMPMWIGKTMTLMPEFICDEYAPDTPSATPTAAQ